MAAVRARAAGRELPALGRSGAAEHPEERSLSSSAARPHRDQPAALLTGPGPRSSLSAPTPAGDPGGVRSEARQPRPAGRKQAVQPLAGSQIAVVTQRWPAAPRNTVVRGSP